MKAEQIKALAETHPFRPFAVRLSNGSQYQFQEPRDFGISRDYATIVYFGDATNPSVVLIDTDNVVEVMKR